MTHHDLALERSYGLKCDADNDQDRCAADADTLKRGYAKRQNDREYSDDSEEYRADQCDLVERVIDEVRSGLARSVARDRTVVLLQVVCDLNRIVLNGNIEIVECDDEQEVDHCIQRTALAEQSYEAIPEGVACSVDSEEEQDSLGKAHQRHCKDDRHNAGHRNLDRNVCRLTAVHLSADYALSVLNRDSALCVGHHDNEPYHCNEDHNSEQNEADVCEVLLAERYEVCYCIGETRDDTCEKYHRDTVADTLFIDSVAQPDDH